MKFCRLLLLFFLVFLMNVSFALTNVSTNGNAVPKFVDEVSMKGVSVKDNIIFDNYDEVSIKNFDKQKISEIHFTGNVSIRFQNNVLKARKVIVTVSGHKVLEIAAFGNVEFRYGRDIYLSKSLIFNPDKERGVLKNVRSYMASGGSGSVSPLSSSQGWYYSAKKATILDKNRVVLEDVFFTTSDEAVPHYSFFAGRLWFFKHNVVYALNLTYTVGQADFIYFPFFIRWEKQTGIKTAFAQEKRIGWYIMNSMGIKQSYGSYDIGFDIYERLGEYGFVNFRSSKAFGAITSLRTELEMADDVRVFTDGDRYTQLVDSDGNGTYQAIRQFSWHYKANMNFKLPDFSGNLNWEDMNDPNFSAKYNQSRKKSFDVKALLQPNDNSFFTRSDSGASTVGSTISRGFSINAGRFALNGKWTYQRQKVAMTNNYLNSSYKYFLWKRNFPNLSYAPKPLTFISNLSAETIDSYIVTVSNTNLTFPNVHVLSNYVKNWILSNQMMQSNTLSVNTNLSNSINDNISSNKITNNKITSMEMTNRKVTFSVKKQVFPYKITAKKFIYYRFTSGLSPSMSYSSSETLNTNGNTVSDHYTHSERGTLSFNGGFLNSLVTWNNNLSFLNQKQWTSLGTNQNDIFNSGASLDLNSTLKTGKTFVAWKGKAWSLTVPFSLSHAISYQLYRTLQASKPREVSHTTSFSIAAQMFKKQLNLSLSATHTLKYRLTNGIDDDFLNNKLEQRLKTSASFKAWWFSASTGLTLDLLKTKTRPLVLDFADFTNRLVSGHPNLSMALTVPGGYLTARYSYDLITKTNLSLSLNSVASFKNLNIPIFYELVALNLSGNFTYNFLSPTLSLFTLNFSIDVKLNKYWRLTFNTSVKNNQIYRYFPGNRDILPEGKTLLNFWEDLLDSLKIWDYDALKRSNFKIQGLNFNLSHDLDEWVLNLQFHVNRRIDTVRRFAYWEPSIRVEFTLKGSSDQFPPYQHKFVPEQYQ